MDSLWDKIKQSLIERASVAAEKAEYLGKIGRARLDIAETRHAIRDRFADLGGLVYEKLRSGSGLNLESDTEVSSLKDAISELEEKLARREETLNQLRAKASEPESETSE